MQPNYNDIDIQTFLKIRHEIPKEQLYDATINVYKRWGTIAFPVDAILEAKSLRPRNYLKDMPSRFEDDDKVRVFRASLTPPSYIDELSEEFSWTVHSKDAMWYAQYGKSIGEHRHIYCAEISKEEIIGYTAHMHQVIQYKGVENIEYLPPHLFDAYAKIYEPHERQDDEEEELLMHKRELEPTGRLKFDWLGIEEFVDGIKKINEVLTSESTF